MSISAVGTAGPGLGTATAIAYRTYLPTYYLFKVYNDNIPYVDHLLSFKCVIVQSEAHLYFSCPLIPIVKRLIEIEAHESPKKWQGLTKWQGAGRKLT